VTLGEGRCLAIVVDLDHSREARSPAHVQVQFERAGIKFYSLLGYVEGAYPQDHTIAFNRTVLAPWWGAWAPAILAMVVGGMVVGLIVTWACLATIYALPVWLVGFYANRDCSLGASWRLAGAALMPGALLLCVFIALYGLGAVDLVHVTIAGALHFMVPWVYLVFSPLCLPGHPQAQSKGNPFA
jgi:hypothetical protein